MINFSALFVENLIPFQQHNSLEKIMSIITHWVLRGINRRLMYRGEVNLAGITILSIVSWVSTSIRKNKLIKYLSDLHVTVYNREPYHVSYSQPNKKMLL